MFPEYGDADSVVFEYIPGSPPLGGAKSTDNFKKMGRLVSSMHDITYPDFFNIDEEGNPTVTSWPVQIAKYIQVNFDDFVEVNSETKDFSKKEVSKVEELIKPLAFHTVNEHSLIHGDLHSHNIMLRENGELVPFDKYEDFLVAPAVYDLAMILSEGFNSSFFVKKDDARYIEDRNYLNAFIEGYGKEFIVTNLDLLKRYALLRALGRFPNKWMLYQVEMMKNILASYS